MLASSIVAGRVVAISTTVEGTQSAGWVLHVRDAASWAERSRLATGAILVPPSVVDGRVYVADREGVLFAVGSASGVAGVDRDVDVARRPAGTPEAVTAAGSGAAAVLHSLSRFKMRGVDRPRPAAPLLARGGSTR